MVKITQDKHGYLVARNGRKIYGYAFKGWSGEWHAVLGLRPSDPCTHTDHTGSEADIRQILTDYAAKKKWRWFD